MQHDCHGNKVTRQCQWASQLSDTGLQLCETDRVLSLPRDSARLLSIINLSILDVLPQTHVSCRTHMALVS